MSKWDISAFESDDDTFTIFPDFSELERKLNTTKDRMELYDVKRVSNVLRRFNIYAKTKFEVSELCNAQNCSIAWLKCYEIISKFNLMNGRKLNIWYNAEFPGSFILAGNHYARTHSIDYEWVASSYIDTDHLQGKYIDNKGTSYLKDQYGLLELNRNRWLNHVIANTGCVCDITDVEDIDRMNRYFSKHKIGVNLYTSDFGLDIGEQYDKQEELHMIGQSGQVLCFLNTLVSGGNVFLKFYTIFRPYTMSLIYLTAKCFDEAYIFKPLSSKCCNSEIYFIGKGYNPSDHTLKLGIALKNRISNNDTTPLCRKVTTDFARKLTDAVTGVVNKQIFFLEKLIEFVKEKKSGKDIDDYMSTFRVNLNIKKIDSSMHLRAKEEIRKGRGTATSLPFRRGRK